MVELNSSFVYHSSLFETSQSLFWASFGLVDLMAFDLAGIKSFTRFWALLMFGSYSVINIIVLLNMLIAMMSNSYQIISERSDVEWKFARSDLWISYFDDGATLPPPFNLFPTVKLLRKFGKTGRSSQSTIVSLLNFFGYIIGHFLNMSFAETFKGQSEKSTRQRHEAAGATLCVR